MNRFGLFKNLSLLPTVSRGRRALLTDSTEPLETSIPAKGPPSAPPLPAGTFLEPNSQAASSWGTVLRRSPEEVAGRRLFELLLKNSRSEGRLCSQEGEWGVVEG